MQNQRAKGVIQVKQAQNNKTNVNHEWYMMLQAWIKQTFQVIKLKNMIEIAHSFTFQRSWLLRPYRFKFFKGCLPQFFTWSILEYLDPYNENKTFHVTTTGLFLYPLKSSKNLRFSDLFRRHKKTATIWNGLKCLKDVFQVSQEGYFTVIGVFLKSIKK